MAKRGEIVNQLLAERLTDEEHQFTRIETHVMPGSDLRVLVVDSYRVPKDKDDEPQIDGTRIYTDLHWTDCGYIHYNHRVWEQEVDPDKIKYILFGSGGFVKDAGPLEIAKLMSFMYSVVARLIEERGEVSQ